MPVVKFHEKNQAAYIGLQAAGGSTYKIPTGTAVISGVATTGVAGQVSFTASLAYVGQMITVTGTLSGTGTITGYATGNIYYVVGTNGTTTATLSAAKGGTPLTTTAGTLTGLTFTASNLNAAEALACTAITADPTNETGSFAYLGDTLSRDEFTYTKDKYINLTLETYQQILVDMSAAIDANTNSIWKVLQLCGANISVNASSKEVTAGNNIESPDYGTCDVRFSSPDDSTNDKLVKFWDLRGSVDINASIGSVPSLKFMLKGNVDTPVAAAKQVAVTGFQTTRVAPPVLYTTVKSAYVLNINDAFSAALGTSVSSTTYTADGRVVITTSAGHGLTVGDIRMIRVSGITTPTLANGDFAAWVTSSTKVEYFVKGLNTAGTAAGTVICMKGNAASQTLSFNNLTCTNFFGFDLARYQTSYEVGFDKGAVPTDVAISVLEDQAGGSSFDPDANLTNFFAVYISFGSAAGTAGTISSMFWDKLQIANVKQGKLASYFARDVTFRNTGSSFLRWT